MMRLISKEEYKEHVKELELFCNENHCLMFNYMKVIKQERKNGQNEKE